MQDNKQHVFEQEVQVLSRAKAILKQNDLSLEQFEKEFDNLTDNFEKLLGDTRVITKISDRLQNKLNDTNDKLIDTNEELKSVNEELNTTNEKLQLTIDELVKARVSKRATTIVFMAAIMLFVVSEVFLEPLVDSAFPNDYIINISIKGSIALLLKPIDYLVERYLLSSAMRKSKMQRTANV